MNLTELIKSEIRQHALDENPNECCGFVVDNRVVRAKNIASNKREDFQIAPLSYIRARKQGNIFAYYHSHPKGCDQQQSYLDRVNSNGHRLTQIIYLLENDSFLVYEPIEWVNPYIGRIFSWGKNDCLTLVLDYYKNELKLNIADNFSRKKDEQMWQTREYLFLLRKYGFEIVEDEPSKHDCIFTQFEENRPPHLMVYVGGGKVLHQPIDEYSKVEDYNDDLRRKTFCIARYNGHN